MALIFSPLYRFAVCSNLFIVLFSLNVQAQEFRVPFDDQQVTQVGSITGIEPPLTIGHVTFSGGGLVRNANLCPANPTPMYSITNPSMACQSPDGTPCQTQGCDTCLDTITVRFDVPVEFVEFEIHGGLKVDSSYRVRDDAGHEEIVTVAAGSIKTVHLPYENLRQVTITYASTTDTGGWKVLLDNFKFYRTTVELDMAESDSVKVLISRGAFDNSYPSVHQTKDATIRISGKVHGAPQKIANRTVYLRVVDPPDTAPYVPTVEKTTNDNSEPVDSIERIPTQVTTDATGVFTAELRTTTQYAGDNYRVEAGLNPDLLSQPEYQCKDDCTRSGTITAWKRIYVEQDQMFRAGAFLTANAIPCLGENCPTSLTIAVDDARPLARAKTLRLMHAPRNDGLGGYEFYSEDVAVIAV
ncbi:MAG TPA: hypothetical protein VF911_12700, partial [Thermoanaerobaculia bacterium]